MGKELLAFIQFDVIYTRQGISNQWTRRIERKADPIKIGTKEIPFFTVHWEKETIEDEKRVFCMVNVKCNPLVNDPNTIMLPEGWQPYEEEALKLTDKEFKKRHLEAEFTPYP